ARFFEIGVLVPIPVVTLACAATLSGDESGWPGGGAAPPCLFCAVTMYEYLPMGTFKSLNEVAMAGAVPTAAYGNVLPPVVPLIGARKMVKPPRSGFAGLVHDRITS